MPMTLHADDSEDSKDSAFATLSSDSEDSSDIASRGGVRCPVPVQVSDSVRSVPSSGDKEFREFKEYREVRAKA